MCMWSVVGFDLYIYVIICKKYFVLNNFGLRMVNEWWSCLI